EVLQFFDRHPAAVAHLVFGDVESGVGGARGFGDACDVDEVDVVVEAVFLVLDRHLQDTPGRGQSGDAGVVGERFVQDLGDNAGLLGDFPQGCLGGILVGVDVTARV